MNVAQAWNSLSVQLVEVAKVLWKVLHCMSECGNEIFKIYK